MQKIKNGYCEYYYLTKDGRVYNEVTNEYKDANKDNRFTLKKEDGTTKKISLKVLYSLVYNRPYCIDDIKDIEGEEWKEIENTNAMYYVSNMGRIKSYKGYRAIILKPTKTKSGYYRVDIIQDGERVSKFVHRLVAVSFLPIPQKMDVEIHHLDYQKENNFYKNLEWLTKAEHRKKHRERIKENAEL